MRLLELDIHAFGGLKDFHLKFPRRMLFLYGANESGKSTIQAFILAMFYGFGRGSKDPEKSARLRYRPWEGAERMGGTIRFELAGKNFRLERAFGKNRSADSCSLFCEDSGDLLKLKDSNSPGNEILALSRSEFEMLSVLERASEGNYSTTVDARVAGLSDSGEESLSIENVRSRLQKEERRLSGGSDGAAIGQLEEAICTLSAELREAESRDQERWEALERSSRLEELLQEKRKRLRAYELTKDIRLEEERCSRWESYLSEKHHQVSEGGGKPRMRAVPVRELTRLSGQKRAVDMVKESRAEALTLYRERDRNCHELAMQQHGHRQRLGEAMRAYDEAVKANNEPIERPPADGSTSLPLLALSFLPFLFLIILRLAAQDIKLWMILAAALLPLMLFGFFLYRDHKLSDKRRRLEGRRHQLALQLRQAEETLSRERWTGQRLEGDLRRWEEARAQTAAWLKAKDEELEKQRRLLAMALRPWIAELPKDLPAEELLQMLRDYSLSSEGSEAGRPGFSPEKEEELRREFECSSARLAKYRQELAALSPGELSDEEGAEEEEEKEERLYFEELAREKAELRLRLPKGPDLADLERKLQRLHEEKARLSCRLSACRQAQSLLEEAEQRFRREARPALLETAGNWLRRLSHGRYEDLHLDSKRVLRAEAPEDRRYHEDIYYSSGTRDLLWLSLRLAAGDLIFKDTERLPLLFDDSLLYLDRERAKTALEALRDVAEERDLQVLLLSSSSEELGLARELGISCQVKD